MARKQESSAPKSDDDSSQGQLTPRDIQSVLSAATFLPAIWVGLMVAAATASAVDVTFVNGDVRWHLAVGAISLTAFALIWLPTG